VSGNSLEFESTSLSEAHFNDVDLRSSRFADVNLADASFSNVSLTGAKFDDVNFGNVAITDANLEGMTIDGILVSELFRAYGARQFIRGGPMSHQAKAGAVLYARNVERVRAFYAGCCGLEVAHSEDDHVVLESPTFQLVILAIPEAIAASISITTPPTRRTDRPIKLFFHVDSIDAIREAAAGLGGELNPPGREWQYQGSKVCDGIDPEGNVVQFRERAR